MRVDPERRAGAAGLRHAAERPHRDRVVAAQRQRDVALLDGVADEAGDLLAHGLDRAEVARVRAALLGRLRNGRADVAPVVDLEAELAQPAVQLCVADRRRPHVDAAAPLTEVEPGADHRDRPPGAHPRD